MALPSTSVAEGQPASRASLERPIDLVHLSRMTLGDRGLEREVLALFDRQATVLVSRMRSASPGSMEIGMLQHHRPTRRQALANRRPDRMVFDSNPRLGCVVSLIPRPKPSR